MVMRKWMRAGAALVAALGLAGVVGCGGGSGNKNDQGVSFLATGTFRGQQSIQNGMIQCVVPNASNAILDSSFTLNITQSKQFPDPEDPFADPCGVFIGLQNNLLGQGINVQEVAVRYEVPGAAVSVPEHSITVGQHIDSADSTIGTPSGQSNLIFLPLDGQILPQTIVVFLNQNVNRLPAAPYVLNVFLEARSQSDNGTNYTSNELGYQLTIEQ